MPDIFTTYMTTHLSLVYEYGITTHTEFWLTMAAQLIFYYPAFQQIRIDRERLIPTNAPFVGFVGTRVFPLGVVMLSVTVGNYPQQNTKDVTFLVVDCSSAYNAILRQPTLNSWKAVTSIYHLMIKFPTDYGVGELRGN